VTGLKIGQRVWLWDVARQRSEGTAQEVTSTGCRSSGARWPEAAAAHQAVEDNTVGKVLIDVAPP
jgi:hypothetical protein